MLCEFECLSSAQANCPILIYLSTNYRAHFLPSLGLNFYIIIIHVSPRSPHPRVCCRYTETGFLGFPGNDSPSFVSPSWKITTSFSPNCDYHPRNLCMGCELTWVWKPLNPPESRANTAEIMFETFNCAGLYIALRVVLALVASWTSRKVQDLSLTGTVVD